MPILTDFDEAMETLQLKLQDTIVPTLATGELQKLLDDNQVASIWEATIDYEIGSVVIPTTNNRNGHRYICVGFDGSGVTSGSTEPVWSMSRNSTLLDGNVTWQEDGAEISLWDMRKAEYDGWLLMADKTRCYVDMKSGDQSFSNSQIPEYCLKRANRCLPARIA